MRTGRASVTILDGVHVEAYGSKMPLNQVAGLSIPEPTLIVAQPFDPSQLGAIEKAIRAADLGLNPANDGKVVRIPMPSLTEERRKELSRHVHKLTEEGRNSVRQVRRDANERLKKLLKDHKISEDDEKKGLDEVQKLTDQHIKHDRRPAEEEGRRSCSASSYDVLLHPSRVLRAVRSAGARSARAPSSLLVRRSPARPLRSRRGARLVARQRSPAASRTCGATAS